METTKIMPLYIGKDRTESRGKGKREVTEDDEREADALCKRHLERWKEELE